MSKKIAIEYQCTHISCRNPKCYKAKLLLEQEKFDLLYQAEGDGKHFRSPSQYCKIGPTQTFEILSQEEIDPSNKDLQIESCKEEIEILRNNIDNLTNSIQTMTSERNQKIQALTILQNKITELQE